MCLPLNDPPKMVHRSTESGNEEVDSKMFLAEDDINLPELFNRVQNVFIQLNQWEQDMKDSVLADKGIQDLLYISEPILKNHVSVMDNTFALIAHSRFRDCDDPVVVDLNDPPKMVHRSTISGFMTTSTLTLL